MGNLIVQGNINNLSYDDRVAIASFLNFKMYENLTLEQIIEKLSDPKLLVNAVSEARSLYGDTFDTFDDEMIRAHMKKYYNDIIEHTKEYWDNWHGIYSDHEDEDEDYDEEDETQE